VAGPDERDRNSLPREAEEVAPSELKVAWCPGFQKAHPSVLRVCAEAVRRYESAGVQVDEIAVELPEIDGAFQTIFNGTFGALLADALPKWRDRMDPSLVELIEAGRRISAYELTRANMARAAYCAAMAKVFKRYDVLLLPVAATHAVPLGLPAPGLEFLYPFNLTGQPAASLPCGSIDGVPVGLQIVARRFQDGQLLRAAALLEQLNAPR
jgi:aspartyl-tRNA(Asn)/glutamyl-tRNA(Gln) amidotransferase subunit A